MEDFENQIVKSWNVGSQSNGKQFSVLIQPLEETVVSSSTLLHNYSLCSIN